jgi:hypothetical protein
VSRAVKSSAGERTRPSTYLVEHYWPGITPAGCRAAADAMARGGARIRYRHSTMVPVDEAAFCVFDAASAELVEQLYAQAGVPFDRIVDALEMEVKDRTSARK